jgi:hypothetical protein
MNWISCYGDRNNPKILSCINTAHFDTIDELVKWWNTRA